MSNLQASLLLRFDQALHVYDVEQQGWEQEPRSMEHNAKHVALHLWKAVGSKNFSSEDVLREQIAPDSLMHALRLRRWQNRKNLPTGNISIEDILPTEAEVSEVRKQSPSFGIVTRPHKVAHIVAASALAGYLHDYDHHAERPEAICKEAAMAAVTGRLLLHSVDLCIDYGRFDIGEAFDARLDNLRQVRGIPLPSNVGNI